MWVNPHYTGTIFGGTYSTLVMGYLEIQFYKKWRQIFGLSAVKYIKENWYRFLYNCNIALDYIVVNRLNYLKH